MLKWETKLSEADKICIRQAFKQCAIQHLNENSPKSKALRYLCQHHLHQVYGLREKYVPSPLIRDTLIGLFLRCVSNVEPRDEVVFKANTVVIPSHDWKIQVMEYILLGKREPTLTKYTLGTPFLHFIR